MKRFLYEYKNVANEETYTEVLSKMTQDLCSAIFQQFDKARIQILKEQ
jgi:hypothetical protein